MAKFEFIFCAVTWGLTNALFVAVAFGTAAPALTVAPTHAVQVAGLAQPATA